MLDKFALKWEFSHEETPVFLGQLQSMRYHFASIPFFQELFTNLSWRGSSTFLGHFSDTKDASCHRAHFKPRYGIFWGGISGWECHETSFSLSVPVSNHKMVPPIRPDLSRVFDSKILGSLPTPALAAALLPPLLRGYFTGKYEFSLQHHNPITAKEVELDPQRKGSRI